MDIKLWSISTIAVVLFQYAMQAQNLSFTCIEDTYVTKSSSGSNYGSEDKLLIKGSTNGNFNRKSYVKFDIAGSNTEYEQILIKLVKFGGEELNEIKTFSTSTSWSENAMTWSTAPNSLNEVSTKQSRIADTLFIDVTDYIKTKIGKSQLLVSFELSSDDIIGSPFTAVSKESSVIENRPKLVFYPKKYINFVESLKLSKYISSDMIIQRGQTFPFRGTGPVGETVTVEFLREGIKTNASDVIDAKGEFSLTIPSMQATANACSATLSIVGYPEKTITLNNILIGDVWFAGGQSNMEKKVDYMLEADAVISDADNFPNIRAFRAQYNAIPEPTDQVKPNNDSWIICNTANVSKASAVAYIFAKRLHKETGVPIGLMQAYVGGTVIETWLSQDKIKDDPKLQFIEDRLPGYDTNASNYNQAYPSVNYNGMVNPLRFFPIKGFLFYQGESNVKRATEYGILFKSLIQNYRAKWNLGLLPFYFVQLFNIGITSERNYQNTPNDNTWQMLRQQQYLVSQTSGLENIGMAVSIETNEERLNPDINFRIHPRNKQPVGERLAKIALKENYNKDIMAYSPTVDSTWVLGNELFIRMKNVGDGLKVRAGATQLTGFALADATENFFEATATIKEPTILSITSSNVSKPKFVAYAWSRDPLCTLDNSEDLPASPFKMDVRTDTSLKVIEDAYIENGNQSSANFGSSLKLNISDGSLKNTTYLKFDISNLLFKPFNAATLNLYTTAAAGTASVTAYTTESNWSENQITSSNAPAIGQAINTANIGSPEVSYELDITQALKTAIDNEALFFSIALKSTANTLVSFASKESTLKAPELILDTNFALGTKLINKDLSQFAVFPNPVKSGVLEIRSQNDFEYASDQIRVINLIGQQFLITSKAKGNNRLLDVSKLASGTYILLINSKNGQFHKKILIQK